MGLATWGGMSYSRIQARIPLVTPIFTRRLYKTRNRRLPMSTKAKTLLALSTLSAILLVSASPSLAKDKAQHRARAAATTTTPLHSAQDQYAAQRSFTRNTGPDYYNAPRSTVGPLGAWDPYAQRWDGAN